MPRPRPSLPALLALATASLAPFPAGAGDDGQVVVESVGGDGAVMALAPGKEPRRVVKGDAIRFWETIQTSPRAGVKVRYPDGSVMVVGRDTKIEIQPRHEGTQYNRLDWGQVRAQVEKEPAKPAGAARPKPRFVIRTKTAVMGVRGTDFVAGFEAVSGRSQLHTLEGVVDFGTDESKVMSWQGMPVGAGQEVSLGGMEPPVARPYDANAYVQAIQAAQPELAALAPLRRAEGEGAAAAPGADDAQPRPPEPPQPPEPPSEPRLRLLQFRAGGVYVRQGASGSAYSPEISWDPSFRLLGPFGVKAHAGAYGAKRGTTGERIYISQLGLLVTLEIFGPFALEAGAGNEDWRVTGGHDPSRGFVMGGVSWTLPKASLFDRFYLVGSRFGGGQFEQANATALHAGLGARF